VWWYLSSKNSVTQMTTQGLGTYQYQCTGGVGFSMTPASDMSSLHITPAEGTSYPPDSTLAKDESTSRAQFAGNGTVFLGIGETVTLTQGDSAVTCSPVSIPDEAPFNFGN